MSSRYLCALLALSSAVGACGTLIGVQDLGVDPAPKPAPAVDGQAAPLPEAGPEPEDAAADPDSSVVGPVLDAAIPRRRVFLTSGVTTGTLAGHPGIAGADALCTAAATSAALGGTWVAWMSGNGKNAIDRLTWDGAFVTLTDRQIVAQKSQFLSGHLDGTIDVTETKVVATSNQPWVWTGTLFNGQASVTCNDWTTENFAIFGTAGSFTRSTDGKWTDNGGPGAGFRNWGCQTNGHLYCFEQQ